jgi:hypothetical protein
MSADKDTRIYAEHVPHVANIAKKDSNSFTGAVNKIIAQSKKLLKPKPARKR